MKIIVLRTPFGRWEWWQALQNIDYIPKGKKFPRESIALSSRDNTLEKAIKTAARQESRRD